MRTLVAPHVHLWTRSEYHQMAELGWFARQHVELIEGQVIDMSPMGSEHATGVALTAKAVERAGRSDQCHARPERPDGAQDQGIR